MATLALVIAILALVIALATSIKLGQALVALQTAGKMIEMELSKSDEK